MAFRNGWSLVTVPSDSLLRSPPLPQDSPAVLELIPRSAGVDSIAVLEWIPQRCWIPPKCWSGFPRSAGVDSPAVLDGQSDNSWGARGDTRGHYPEGGGGGKVGEAFSKNGFSTKTRVPS